MRVRSRVLPLLFAILLSPNSARAQDVFKGCGMEGDAHAANVMALNRLKNRYTEPTTINPKVTLKAMLEPGDDRTRWKVKDGAEVVGYVADVKVGGIETCNCHARKPDDRDTHIELCLNPMDGESKRVIVEVTPRWRAMMKAKGVDWTTKALRSALLGRWVKVRGWMLFDAEHKNQAENTAPGNPRNWRATSWEIHPVTSIEVTTRPLR